MSTRVVDRVDDWDQRPFSGGYGALADLAAEEFSGVVRAGGAEVYLTAGTAVAVRRGTIEDVEDASGTAFVAPDPALPLLAIMQEADAEVRAQYYSEETPISEVDATLSDGGFTGYLELSENVLSGDYYLIYHGGTSSSVAFVGASEQLITGDEAFETADDEVGIYKVRQVDVEPIEIPETDSASPPAEADEPADDEATGDESAGTDAGEDGDTDEAAPETEESEPAGEGASEPDEEGAAGSSPEGGATAAAEARGDARSTGTTEPSGTGQRTAADADRPSQQAPGGRAEARAGADDRSEPARGGTQQTQSRRGQQAGGSTGQAGDLETRGVPSLDPDQTSYPQRSTDAQSGPPTGGGARTGTREPSTGRPSQQRSAGEPAPERGRERQPAGGEAGGTPAEGRASADAASADLAELEDELAEREAEIEELEAELETARSERDDLEADLERVREERDELQAEADRLREELERLEEELGAATDAERRMTPTEAIEGTNLFVDYESKGQATLEKAHGGSETREDVTGNLQLGVHTEFDDRSVAVGGQDFGEFLRGTLQYRFAEWLVGQLLFEIRDTGHAESLTDLYDAIPEIRRVEFNGTIDVEYVEDGQEKVATEHFDVVFRHRMGDPLVVANLNDSREPATGSDMTSLVTAAERVGQTEESLAAAFLVTSSYFESEALETVSEATKGGILSRDKRASFVNLSRKAGYHLCLVAAREGNFHMEVPEL